MAFQETAYILNNIVTTEKIQTATNSAIAGFTATDVGIIVRLSAIESSDAGLVTRVVALEAGGSGTLSSDVVALQMTDVAIIIRLSAIESSDTDLVTRVVALETTDTVIISRIDAITTTDTAIITQMGAIISSDAKQNSDIAALQSTDAGIITRLDARTSDIVALQSTDAGIITRLTGLTSTDTATITRIDAITSSDAKQNSDIFGLQILASGFASTDAAIITRIGTITSSDAKQNSDIAGLQILATGFASTDTAIIARVDAITSSDAKQNSDITSLQAFTSDFVLLASFTTNTRSSTNNMLVMNRVYTYELDQLVRRMTTVNFVDIDPRPTGSSSDLLIVGSPIIMTGYGGVETDNCVLSITNSDYSTVGFTEEVCLDTATANKTRYPLRVHLHYNNTTPNFQGWLFRVENTNTFLNFHDTTVLGDRFTVFGASDTTNFEGTAVTGSDYLYKIGYTSGTSTLRQYQIRTYDEPELWVTIQSDIAHTAPPVASSYSTVTLFTGSDLSGAKRTMTGPPIQIAFSGMGSPPSLTQARRIASTITAPTLIKTVAIPGIDDPATQITSDSRIAFRIDTVSDMRLYYGAPDQISDLMVGLANTIINVQTSDGVCNTQVILEASDVHGILVPGMILDPQLRDDGGNHTITTIVDGTGGFINRATGTGTIKIRTTQDVPDAFFSYGVQNASTTAVFTYEFHITSDPYIEFWSNSDTIWKMYASVTSSDNCGLHPDVAALLP